MQIGTIVNGIEMHQRSLQPSLTFDTHFVGTLSHNELIATASSVQSRLCARAGQRPVSRYEMHNPWLGRGITDAPTADDLLPLVIVSKAAMELIFYTSILPPDHLASRKLLVLERLKSVRIKIRNCGIVVAQHEKSEYFIH